MRRRRKGRSRLAVVLGVLVLMFLVLWLMLTSAKPLFPEPAAPTAEQVAAGRDAYRQLRNAKSSKNGMPVVLGPAQLDGLGAVASHGFRPDRLRLATERPQLRIEASHHLPLGRWLNVTLLVDGPSAGFPAMHLKVGALKLSPALSRMALEGGRWLLHLRRPNIPQLDDAVRNFTVGNGSVAAVVSLPGKSGIVDQMAGVVSGSVDRDQVLRIYCALTDRQRRQPSGDFAEQVRRAFSINPEGTSQADFNRSAFVALAIMLVDRRAENFASLSPSDLGKCAMEPFPVSIHGRFDWPKHWALSAAISAAAGTQLSEAAGEWKELADSLEMRSRIDDPSGFSMADLAADRSGFEIARAAARPDDAERLARELAKATPDQILPSQVTSREDGLSHAEFVRRYGGIDDPRFKARVREIDSVLGKTGLR